MTGILFEKTRIALYRLIRDNIFSQPEAIEVLRYVKVEGEDYNAHDVINNLEFLATAPIAAILNWWAQVEAGIAADSEMY